MQGGESSCTNADCLLRLIVGNVVDGLLTVSFSLSVTFNSVRKIGSSEACYFALLIRPENVPTRPWTGKNYMSLVR